MVNNFNDDIFKGFYKKRDRVHCIIINMLEDDIIDLDGNINIDKITTVEVDDLWIYIYYLWKNNNTIETSIFYKMTMPNGNASASLFINGILDYLKGKGVTRELVYYNNNNIKALLINFLSEIIDDKDIWVTINIPILSSIYTKVIKKLNGGLEIEDNNDINTFKNEKEITINLVAGIDQESGKLKLDLN